MAQGHDQRHVLGDLHLDQYRFRSQFAPSHHLGGQPRRWITSASLSPAALAPVRGANRRPPNTTPTVSIVMSRVAQTAAGKFYRAWMSLTCAGAHAGHERRQTGS